ncbi:hypothetical protein FKM82_014784 [Ascaphus truei]
MICLYVSTILLVWKFPCTTFQGTDGHFKNSSSIVHSKCVEKPPEDLCLKLSDLKDKLCVTGPKCELCPLSWVALNGKCYYFSEERKNWSASREYCEQIKSKIISMEEDKEKVLISNQVPMRKGHFWIGLRKTDGHWYWETGGKLQKDIFSEVSGEHHCATFGNNLSSESCSNPNKWICKKKAYVFP